MLPASILFLGLELTRFASSDGAVGGLAGSLDAIQSGGWALSPYEGPAIQPYLGWRKNAIEAGLAPAMTWARQDASSADGRTGALQVLQWRLEGRLRYSSSPWFVGVDGGYSDGSARLDGQAVADGTPALDVGPTVGVREALSPHVDVVLRVRWPLRFVDDSVSHGPGGGFALEWHP
jgi:hypothetical protein